MTEEVKRKVKRWKAAGLTVAQIHNLLAKERNGLEEINGNIGEGCSLDANGKLLDIIWVDARSRAASEKFGDVVVFDTTYLINQRIILLGCALVSHEITETFTC
ncbi:Protein FAR1-RELATED SEQUENCE 7 [Bienertia sinuspersici]